MSKFIDVEKLIKELEAEIKRKSEEREHSYTDVVKHDGIIQGLGLAIDISKQLTDENKE